MRLGTLMVDAGLLTEHELNEALAAHQTSGRPLGEVIVTLGFASPGAVANALAEQYGGPLQTEYGVSLGLGARPEPGDHEALEFELDLDSDFEPESVGEPPTPPASISVVPIPENADTAAAELHEAREAIGRAARERESLLERIGVLETRLGDTEELARELAACREREAERRAAVEQANAAAAAAEERATAAESQLGELRGRLTALDRDTAEAAAAEERATAAVAAAAARATAAESQLEEVRSRLAALEGEAAGAARARQQAEAAGHEVLELRARLESLAAELEQERAQPVEPPEPSHLLFLPSPAGYAISEAEGPCPEPGAAVSDPEGHPYRVSRIGRSPLGDGRRCAYLEPATA